MKGPRRCLKRLCVDASYFAPNTASLSPLAAVKRKRVRAGILICSPLAGFRPMRALLLRLRKTPRPLSRSTPSFFSCLTTRGELVEQPLGLLFLDTHFPRQVCGQLCLCHLFVTSST